MREKLAKLLGREGLRYASNTGWLLVQRVFSMAGGLLVGIYVARHLGATGFGVLSFAQGLVGLVSPLVVLGLDNVLVRELVRRPEEHGVLMGTAMALRIIAALSVLALLLLLISAQDLPAEEHIVAILVSFSLLSNLGGILNCHFQAEVQGKVVAKIAIVHLFVSLALRLAFVLLSLSVAWFACALLWDAIFSSSLLTFAYFMRRRGGLEEKWRFDSRVLRTLLSKSWPLIFSGLALGVYMKLDQVMIQRMLGTAAVGHYSAAVRISESWLMLAVILTTSLYPSLISARQRSEALFRERLQWFYGLMLWSSLLIAVPVGIFAVPLVRLIYGSEFDAAGPVLSVHVWSGVMVFLITASSRWYLIKDQETSILYRALLGAILNVGLNFYLIPLNGIVGAAQATLLSYAAMALLYDLLDPHGAGSFRGKLVALAFPWLVFKAVLRPARTRNS